MIALVLPDLWLVAETVLSGSYPDTVLASDDPWAVAAPRSVRVRGSNKIRGLHGAGCCSNCGTALTQGQKGPCDDCAKERKARSKLAERSRIASSGGFLCDVCGKMLSKDSFPSSGLICLKCCESFSGEDSRFLRRRDRRLETFDQIVKRKKREERVFHDDRRGLCDDDNDSEWS